MQIATILFTYNRSWHTQQVLDGLRENTVLPEKLFIFQDGLKCEEHQEEWNKVNQIINGIRWCDCEVIISEKNNGLADSIISGINKVFAEYDAVIVLEDDCVPNINFIKFMHQCLEKYQNVPSVHSVSGYAWPIELPENEMDIYFCGRVSSWGWGTWKDRWSTYQRDYAILKNIKRNGEMSRELAVWGNDLENMLLANLRGEVDSWAVFWALNAIQNQKVCINPYRSLIQNIGCDGTGVHCEITNRFQVKEEERKEISYKLPEDIKVLDSTRKAFVDLYGSSIAMDYASAEKKDIVVYGLGNFYFKNERSMNQKYHIKAFVDKKKKGYYGGKQIITLNEISQWSFDEIVIMIQNTQECINIADKLINVYGVPYNKIVLGQSMYGPRSKEFQVIKVMPDGKLEICANGLSVQVCSLDEFNNVREVLVEQSYCYEINNKKKDIVLDVGMNIGDATLYFLKNTNVKKVYAFEPFKKTFDDAQKNLKEYLGDERLEMFQFGLSNVNEIRKIGFNEGMTCGQSTVVHIRDNVYQTYLKSALIDKANEKLELIEVKNVSEVFAPIISQHPECNIILKMDCEGEEYGVMEELMKTGLLADIDFIMMEWHYKGKESILKYLKQAGFSYWCSDKSSEMGLIYAYNMNK